VKDKSEPAAPAWAWPWEKEAPKEENPAFKFPWDKTPAKKGPKMPWEKEPAAAADDSGFAFPWAQKPAKEEAKPAWSWPWAKPEEPTVVEKPAFPWDMGKGGAKAPWEKPAAGGGKKPAMPWEDPDFVFPWDAEKTEGKQGKQNKNNSKNKEKQQQKDSKQQTKPKKNGMEGMPGMRATTLLDRLSGTSSWETMAWVLLVLSLILSVGLIVAIYFQVQQRRRYERIGGFDGNQYQTGSGGSGYGNAERAPFASGATAPRYNDEKQPLQQMF